ncbi:hypothetical protein NC651_019720 [Populus alba x Populus x berolinensis]|nr:hypothetical protein NC651_019720 [Populus alba x Populus x berolinensis]
MGRSFKHTRDDRDRDHHKHRSRDEKHRDSSDSHHHRSERESHQRENHKSSRRDDTKRERSHEREESVDRRERTHDHKSSSSSRREERERSLFGEKEKKGERSSEDRAVVEKEKRSRRRFGEKVKEEDNRTDNNDNGNSFENVKRVDSSEAGVKEEVKDEPIGGGKGSTTENGGVSTTNESLKDQWTPPAQRNCQRSWSVDQSRAGGESGCARERGREERECEQG